MQARDCEPSGFPALFLDVFNELGVSLEGITPNNIEVKLILAIKENRDLNEKYPHLLTLVLYWIEVTQVQNEKLKKFEADNPPREWDELYEKRFPSIWAHLQGWMRRETSALKEYQEAGGKADYYITANFLAQEHKAINNSLRIEETDLPKHFFKYLSEKKNLDGDKVDDGRNNEWLRKDGVEPDSTTPRKYLLGDKKSQPNSIANDLFEKMKPVRVYYE